MADEAKRGVRWWTKRAEEHALGILDSQDDEAFWADDIEDVDDADDDARRRAREIINRRIRSTW